MVTLVGCEPRTLTLCCVSEQQSLNRRDWPRPNSPISHFCEEAERAEKCEIRKTFFLSFTHSNLSLYFYLFGDFPLQEFYWAGTIGACLH